MRDGISVRIVLFMDRAIKVNIVRKWYMGAVVTIEVTFVTLLCN